MLKSLPTTFVVLGVVASVVASPTNVHRVGNAQACAGSCPPTNAGDTHLSYGTVMVSNLLTSGNRYIEKLVRIMLVQEPSDKRLGIVALESSSTMASASSTSSSEAPQPTKLPKRWFRIYECAIDNADRVFRSPFEFYKFQNNTPAACATLCDSRNFTFAGLEFGEECFCGNGFVRPWLPSSPASECNTTCTGDSNQTCGGDYRIAIYGPPQP